MDDYLPTVLDIETHPNGDLADIGLLHADIYQVFTTWDSFLDYVKMNGTKKQHIRSKGKDGRKSKHPELREIWAHYGGGFDWLHFIEWFKGHRDEYQFITIKVSGGIVIGIDITLPARSGTIRLRDSLRLMPAGLQKLADSFGIRGKVKLDGRLPTQIKAENPELYYEYLETDCSLLRDVLIQFFQSLRQIAPIEKLSLTIASQSMAIYKHFQPSEFYQSNDRELTDWMRRGYTGGRVELFKPGYHENVEAVDFNSLYPSVMAIGTFPAGERGNWTTRFEGRHGLYEIEYRQHTDQPALLRDEETGEFTHQGKGVYTAPELEKLKELGGNFKLIKGYAVDYEYICKPFEQFVSKLWGMRRHAQEQGQDALQYTIKILLNSLYGKFGESSDRESFVLLDFEEMCEWVGEKSRTLEPYFEGNDCYVWTHEAVHTSSIIPIASYVTAYARLALYRVLELLGPAAIYSDTDSAYYDPTLGELPLSFIGNELGQLKPEFHGSGLFLGRKLYGLDGHFAGNQTKTQKLKIKGVKLGGNMGADYQYADMVKDWNQRKEAMKVTLGFQSFPTLREVLTNKAKPAKLVTRERTIKPTY